MIFAAFVLIASASVHEVQPGQNAQAVVDRAQAGPVRAGTAGVGVLVQGEA